MSAREWDFLGWLFESVIAFFLRIFDGLLKASNQVDEISDEEVIV